MKIKHREVLNSKKQSFVFTSGKDLKLEKAPEKSPSDAL